MNKESHTIEGIHYSSGNRIRIQISDGLIRGIDETVKDHIWDEKELTGLPVIAPGLVDLQINGYRGVDFNDPDLTPELIEQASEELLVEGVCTYYPTLITGSPERIGSLLKTFAKALGQKGLASRMIGGIHLEGPFISREDGPRGAHDLGYCMNPNLELLRSWQEQAHGNIRIITLAPELPGSEGLIKSCVSMGMVVGIGHTAANTQEIKQAVEAGATLSTHLGNGCHSTLPRHPNYIWDQLAQEKLSASLIADGFHLPNSVLQVFTKTKGDRAILISDGMTYTGLEPGLYDSSATGKVRLTPEGKLHQDGKPGTLAGSACTLLDGVRHMSPVVGFVKAWDMGSVGPAQLLNLDCSKGLSEGAPAKLVLLEPDLSRLVIHRVI